MKYRGERRPRLAGSLGSERGRAGERSSSKIEKYVTPNVWSAEKRRSVEETFGDSQALRVFLDPRHQGPAVGSPRRRLSSDRPSIWRVSSRAIVSSRSTSGPRHVELARGPASPSSSDATSPATVENADSRPRSL